MIKLIPIKDDCEKVYIIINNVEVGKLNHYITKEIIMIKYILIYDEFKTKGYATKVINYLKEKYTNRIICGDALPEAIGFWTKMNAEFSDPTPSKIRPEVLLTPFQIKY